MKLLITMIFACFSSLSLLSETIFFADAPGRKIEASDTSGLNRRTIVDVPLPFAFTPLGMDVDSVRGKLYWAGRDNGVMRSNFDGTNIETVVSGLDSVVDVSLDLENDKIYWSDVATNKIQRSNLDGSFIEDVANNVDHANGLDIDATNQHVYWGNRSGGVQRIDFDGSNITDIVSSTGRIGDVIIDVEDNFIYWSDSNIDGIRRSDLLGSNIVDLVDRSGSAFGANQITLNKDDSLIYFTSNDGSVREVGLNGLGENLIIGSDLGQPIGIAFSSGDIGGVPAVPEPSTYIAFLLGFFAVCFCKRK